MPGDQLPNLMTGFYPTTIQPVPTRIFRRPGLVVADNDLAVGRIVALTHSRFADNTVIFISKMIRKLDVGLFSLIGLPVLSERYSRLKKTVGTNYNQTSMVIGSIEQRVRIASDECTGCYCLTYVSYCFNDSPILLNRIQSRKNNIPLNEMNPQETKSVGCCFKWSDRSVQYASYYRSG
ncbi:MAG: hypothetical protein IPG82_19680 [Saprospiraceae bacterium]|nr:hypothetical protein [Saprospiraceae bacterium]